MEEKIERNKNEKKRKGVEEMTLFLRQPNEGRVFRFRVIIRPTKKHYK